MKKCYQKRILQKCLQCQEDFMAIYYNQTKNIIQKCCSKSCHAKLYNKTRNWAESSKSKISKANTGRLIGAKNPNYSNAYTELICIECMVVFKKENYNLRASKYSGKFCTRACYINHNQKNKRTPIQIRLYRVFGRNIASCLKKGKKRTKWTEMVGYSLSDLRKHLEVKFKEGMTWDNYGRYGWHIDHIKPVSFFNFYSPQDEEFLKCWALENLQPLWATENLKKGGSNRKVNREKYGQK